MREAQARGDLDITIETTTFQLREHQRFLDANAADIAAFRTSQQAAFQAEREQWERDGEFSR